MAMIAMAVPILPGKTEQFWRFVEELKEPRNQEFVASRQRAGVRERAFFQSTPQGDLVILTFEGEDLPNAMQRLLIDDEFSRWEIQQGLELNGIDFSQPPPGPLPELVIDSQAE